MCIGSDIDVTIDYTWPIKWISVLKNRFHKGQRISNGLMLDLRSIASIVNEQGDSVILSLIGVEDQDGRIRNVRLETFRQQGDGFRHYSHWKITLIVPLISDPYRNTRPKLVLNDIPISVGPVNRPPRPDWIVGENGQKYLPGDKIGVSDVNYFRYKCINMSSSSWGTNAALLFASKKIYPVNNEHLPEYVMLRVRTSGWSWSMIGLEWT